MKTESIQPKSAANVTPEILAAWKNAYPAGISELQVTSGEFKTVTEEGNPPKRVPIIKYKGWVRKPSRDEMRELMALASSTDLVTYTERILDIIWLGGDEEILMDDEAFYAIMPEVQKVLDIKRAQLKKM